MDLSFCQERGCAKQKFTLNCLVEMIVIKIDIITIYMSNECKEIINYVFSFEFVCDYTESTRSFHLDIVGVQ